MTPDWTQLTDKRCPHCRGCLQVKSLLEEIYSCSCGFEITGAQFERITTRWLYKVKAKPVIIRAEDLKNDDEKEESIAEEYQIPC